MALACVAMIDSAIAYHGIVLPASRYCAVVRLPRLRQTPYSTMPASDAASTAQSSGLTGSSSW